MVLKIKNPFWKRVNKDMSKQIIRVKLAGPENIVQSAYLKNH